jgi:MFS transporter, ACS family, hexuronate transporter
MLGRLQWMTVGLIFSGGLINYMDRAVFGVLATSIAKELVLNAAQMGWVFSAFSFGYVAFCFIGGWAADRFGVKRTVAVAMAVWSLSSGLIGSVTTLPALLSLRAVFGAGESPWLSAANKMMMRWFSREDYPRAYGIATAGGPLGGVVAGPLVGIVAGILGWRAAFVAVAAVGFVWLIFWLRYAADSPEQHPGLDRHSRDAIATFRADGARGSTSAKTSLGRAFFRPTVLATSFAFFCFSYMLFFFISWFPSYLVTELKLDPFTMGVVSAVPWLFGAVGLVAGGIACTWVINHGGEAFRANKAVLVIGLLMTGGSVAACALTSSPTLAVIFMASGVGFLYSTGGAYYVIGLEGIPFDDMAKMGSVFVTINVVGGILSPVITGYIVQSTGSFVGAFMLASGLVVLGSIVVGVIAKREEDH